MKKINALIILDGYGKNPDTYGNAIAKANTPFIDSLLAKYPNTLIGASGLNVGLPDGQMGNSEVGHLNMGAGRIVYQELTRITKSIQDGDFFENSALLAAMKNAKENGKKLHAYGLVSDGGVHSHLTHLFALVKMAKDYGVKDFFVHCFLDGRDVPPESGADYVKQLADYMKEIGYGKIATVTGRFYAMDRDNRWERVVKAYDMLTQGEGVQAVDPVQAIRDSYKAGVTDEFVLPTVITENGSPVAKIEKGDSIVFFNFRPDRAREITRSFIYEDFDKFERKTGFINPVYVCLTQYDATFADVDNVYIAFKPQHLNNTLGEIISQNGLKQLRIAETEKYAHVTFFFNGGVEAPNANEERVLIPSPKVATYDMKPEMSAYEVAAKAAELIKSGVYDAMILNFANCDMVGHTGVFDAAVAAVEAVDNCLKTVVDAILSVGGQAIVTADHGNADKMFEHDGTPFTAHTTNPVPLIVVKDGDFALRDGGILADVAPTLLQMMGIAQPVEMTGKTLIK